MFRMIRSKLDKSTALILEEILLEMNEIAYVLAHIMDTSKLRNWHHVTKTFKALPNIKKKFYSSIRISKVQKRSIHVWVKELFQGNKVE